MEVKGIPQWVPDSYPAFPIRSSEPLRMFLSMATSIHGYERGMIPLLQDVFENRPTQAAGYLEVLKETIM